MPCGRKRPIRSFRDTPVLAEQYLGANSTNLDFITQPDQSRLTINKWVEDKTGQKIKNLIPAGAIDPMTRLVITNAIYFKGEWVKAFDKSKTTDADFMTGPRENGTGPYDAADR